MKKPGPSEHIPINNMGKALHFSSGEYWDFLSRVISNNWWPLKPGWLYQLNLAYILVSFPIQKHLYENTKREMSIRTQTKIAVANSQFWQKEIQAMTNPGLPQPIQEQIITKQSLIQD